MAAMRISNLAQDLAAALPDEPRWLETRAMLLTPGAEVSGGRTRGDGFVVRVLEGALSAVAVVGAPGPAAILRSVDGATAMTPLLAQIENEEHVRGVLGVTRGAAWRPERAILHRLADHPPLSPAAPGVEVRLLAPGDPLDHLVPELRHEIAHARWFAPIATVFVDGVAASFCYPCWTTESFWDVSIDTLPEFRGASLAARAVAFMVDHMRPSGREPVWGALETNAASLRLAAKLGFRPVDRIVVFSKGHWAFLTAGFPA